MQYRKGLVLALLLSLGLSLTGLIATGGLAHGEVWCSSHLAVRELELVEVIVDAKRQDDLSEYKGLRYEIFGDDLSHDIFFLIENTKKEPAESELMEFRYNPRLII